MTATSCSAFVRMLSLRLDGALARAQLGQLEEHLAGCAACRARELSLLAQGEVLRAAAARRLESLEASGAIDLTGFSAQVMRAAERDADQPSRWPSRWEQWKIALRERWQHQRLALSGALGVAAAGCAALALVLAARVPAHGPLDDGLLAVQGVQTQASIDALELMTGTTGAVFEAPGQTTVIWLSDEAVE